MSCSVEIEIVLSDGTSSGMNEAFPALNPIRVKKANSPTELSVLAWVIFPSSKYNSPPSFPLKMTFPVFLSLNRGLRMSKSLTSARSPRNVSSIKYFKPSYPRLEKARLMPNFGRHFDSSEAILIYE